MAATLAADKDLPFFFLAGDANRDRTVDVTDLGILATNWQQSPQTFSQADFSYDGVVDVTDLGILATNWQRSVPAPGPAPGLSKASLISGKIATVKRVSQATLAADVIG